MSSAEVKKAQWDVKRSTAEFEYAVNHLERKINATVQKVEHAKDLAGSPGRFARNMIDRTRATTGPLVERARVQGGRVVTQAVRSSRDLAEQARENPRPYVLGGLALVSVVVGGILLLRSRQDYESKFG